MIILFFVIDFNEQVIMSLKASEKARISKNDTDIGNDLEKQALSDQPMNKEGSMRENGDNTSRKKSKCLWTLL